MAYPASTKTLQKWVQDVDQQVTVLKQAAQQQHGLSAAGTLNMDFVRRFYDLLKQSHVFFGAAAAVTGIAAYVTAEKQDQVADPATEFQEMRAAVADTISWLNANIPQGTFGGNSYKLGWTFPADNVTPSSPLTVTAAQTNGYRTVLTALIATIG